MNGKETAEETMPECAGRFHGIQKIHEPTKKEAMDALKRSAGRLLAMVEQIGFDNVLLNVDKLNALIDCCRNAVRVIREDARSEARELFREFDVFL